MFSQCRHIESCWTSVSEHGHGTKGTVDISGARIYDADGNLAFNGRRLGRDGHQQEHHDLFADLRAGNLPNEAEYGALSTMTSILGRMCTYSGKKITWEEALNSKIKLADVDSYVNFQDTPPVLPDPEGNYEIAIPGKTVTV
jgi:hypothetical protein